MRPIFAQKVGVVLSGGGASGIVHVGFLKALEENNIPIDYIAGTSMGAVIGGLYSSGYSPVEIEALLTSEEFRLMVSGEFEDRNMYFFKRNNPNASWLSFKLSLDKILKSLPTNFVTPVALDLRILKLIAGAEVVSHYNFDSLFIPFRCVAADIKEKKQVVFRNGHLSEAIRASATFPFYFKPIKINGNLMFDGGLYNNFPTDVMYNDFFPDIIIGCNVGNLNPTLDEDDLLSQIQNMMVSETNYSIICDNGILIEPDDSELGTFAFELGAKAVAIGYETTLKKMDEIQTKISRRISPEELTKKRNSFRGKYPDLVFNNIEINGLNASQAWYVKKSLGAKKNMSLNFDRLEKSYLKVFHDDKILSIFPRSNYDTITQKYTLDIDVKKSKELDIEIGGNFSSRPINTGYLGAKYNYLGRISMGIMGNYYFGKFYNSAQIKTRIDFPVFIPFYLEPHYTVNRWNYFKGSGNNVFFEEEAQTNFYVQREQYGGLSVGLPFTSRGKWFLEADIGGLNDQYFLNNNFSAGDTADVSKFDFVSTAIKYEMNTLNRKQYAHRGYQLLLGGRYVEGREKYFPGSTGIDINNEPYATNYHQWFQFNLRYDNYYLHVKKLHLGIFLEGYYSTQSNFFNYSASLLRAPYFQPTIESKTLFLESFRAYKYLAIGKKIVFQIIDNIDIRLEGYMFQPYEEILLNQTDNTTLLGEKFNKRYTLASGYLVYHSPFGPLSLGLNYYHNVPEIEFEDRAPVTFLFHFGYVLFNKRALR